MSYFLSNSLHFTGLHALCRDAMITVMQITSTLVWSLGCIHFQGCKAAFIKWTLKISVVCFNIFYSCNGKAEFLASPAIVSWSFRNISNVLIKNISIMTTLWRFEWVSDHVYFNHNRDTGVKTAVWASGWNLYGPVSTSLQVKVGEKSPRLQMTALLQSYSRSFLF